MSVLTLSIFHSLHATVTDLRLLSESINHCRPEQKTDLQTFTTVTSIRHKRCHVTIWPMTPTRRPTVISDLLINCGPSGVFHSCVSDIYMYLGTDRRTHRQTDRQTDRQLASSKRTHNNETSMLNASVAATVAVTIAHINAFINKKTCQSHINEKLKNKCV